MANQPVTVVVRLKARPGKEAQVRQELFNLLAPTRAEQGCINFDMHEETRMIRLYSCSMKMGRAKNASSGISKLRISNGGSSWLKLHWLNRSS